MLVLLSLNDSNSTSDSIETNIFSSHNHNIECRSDDFERMLFESITKHFLYTYLLGHFAMHQTDLHLAIRLSHPLLFVLFLFFLFYLPYLSSIHEKANCIVIL